MCKASLAQSGSSIAWKRALHAPPILSTGFLERSVQTVGNAVLNSVGFTALPAFHFPQDGFSKTWTALICAG
jgi:hypothetical protein